jgi:hypothetical protein
VAAACLAVAAPPAHAQAQGTIHIQVRVTKVMISDDMDATGAGEIKWAFAAATGNRGQAPTSTQTFGFPLEKWYEASTNGANSTLMGGIEQGVPVFDLPESQMGDSLVITFGVLDDDSNPRALLDVHQAARVVGAAFATAFTGPAGGALVTAASQVVQDALENDGADVIGYAVVVHGRGDRFGTGANGTFTNTVQTGNGKAMVTYNVRRVRVRTDTGRWCAGVKLKQVKILGDGDPGHPTKLPGSGTRDVAAGRYFRVGQAGVQLYPDPNGPACQGLPPFLYVEVDVLEDDDEDDDDILGVLPIMVSSGWLREHKGTWTQAYLVRGADSDEKVRITLQIEVWDPGSDPDGPAS